MKLYTKRGDAGSTDLFGGRRIGKTDRRIEAIGAVDELNGLIGFAVAQCRATRSNGFDGMGDTLCKVQHRLFEIGADLSSPGSESSAIPHLSDEEIAETERLIDAADADLPPMKHFILPGGTELAARLHVARGVCRRAERRCVALHEAEPINSSILIYLNRLSDLLFVLARRANALADVPDVPWIAPRR